MKNPLLIAREIVELAEKKGDYVTPMKLIKLVYLAHAWMLAIYKRPLIDAKIEAWKYGPVIPKLYKAIKHFRNGPVDKMALKTKFALLDEDEKDIIIQTFEQYGNYSAIELSSITHEPGSPWETAFNSGAIKISNGLIFDYYRQTLDND